MKYKKELEVAKHAAREAGEFLMKKFKKPHQNKISYKQKREIVTDADIGADKIIDKIITKNFKDHEILSEEIKRGKIKGNWLWHVDPLDGTNNFAHGLPIFAVCIALAEKDDLKVGVVYLPYYKQMFWATKGGGAYLDGKKIELSKTKKLKDSLILLCHGYTAKDKKTYHKIFEPINKKAGVTRRLGAAGYELVSVATGHAEGAFILGTRPWDSAAGALIVREAGGKVTNFKGEDWSVWDKNILFSNGKVHFELLKIVQK